MENEKLVIGGDLPSVKGVVVGSKITWSSDNLSGTVVDITFDKMKSSLAFLTEMTGETAHRVILAEHVTTLDGIPVCISPTGNVTRSNVRQGEVRKPLVGIGAEITWKNPSTDSFPLSEENSVTGRLTGIGIARNGRSGISYKVVVRGSTAQAEAGYEILPAYVTHVNGYPVAISVFGEVLYCPYDDKMRDDAADATRYAIQAMKGHFPAMGSSKKAGLNMLCWKDGLPPRPDNETLAPVVTALMALQYDKEGTYGSSWKGKGEYRGIMANIDRKYDRLDKITDDEITGSRPTLPKVSFDELSPDDYESIGESKIDAVADLANYSLLYLAYLRITYPGAFQVWVDRNIPNYLRDKIPFL